MRIISTIIYILGIILFFSSCKKDDDAVPDCGCESETLLTIPNEEYQIPIEEQKSGLLFYKHPEDIDGYYDNDQYNNRFWIFQGTEGCYNCQRNFIICNEEILVSEYDYLKNKNVHDSVEVQFSGNTKRMCIITFGPADYDYKEIILTSIEKNKS